MCMHMCHSDPYYESYGSYGLINICDLTRNLNLLRSHLFNNFFLDCSKNLRKELRAADFLVSHFLPNLRDESVPCRSLH